jgi:hypothetical protein
LGSPRQLIFIVLIEVMALWPIVSHAFAYGVILSIVLFTLILGLTRVNPEIMLKDYPPDIQAKYGPMSERSKRQRLPVAIFFIAMLLVIVAMSFREVRTNAGGDIPFLAAVVHLFVMFSVFNLLDWLVLDWLIVVTIRPSFIVLPGTEGLPGYKDYGFHFRGFVIGMGITIVTCVLVAGVVAALF